MNAEQRQTAAPTLGPSQRTWAIGPPAKKLHPPSPFIITQPENRHSFYHPTEGRRLSRQRWLVICPRAVTVPSSNLARYRLTTLIEAIALSTTLRRQLMVGLNPWQLYRDLAINGLSTPQLDHRPTTTGPNELYPIKPTHLLFRSLVNTSCVCAINCAQQPWGPKEPVPRLF